MTDDPDAPLPLVQAADDEAVGAAFGPDGPTPETPLGAAALWHLGLQDPQQYATALQNLSVTPEVWGDYSEASAAIKDLSMATNVVRARTREDVAYVKFLELAGDTSAIAFDEAELTEFWIVTVVKPRASEWWLVWGISHNLVPDEHGIPTY